MHKKLLFLFLFLFVEILTAQPNVLSEQSEISVLTIGSGTSLNDAFGHSAFRIKDPIKGIDLVFNYGVYDFETPNFYLKFAQGKLNYLMGVNYYEDFFENYVAQNRTIKEQVLNISLIEKQKLFDYLLNNYKPENRAYLYEFFFDNCATKIRDVIEITSNYGVEFETPKDLKSLTFRQLIYKNVQKNSWGSLGIDVALGSVIDKKATAYEYMFLPEYIYEFFNNTYFPISDKPLVKKINILYEKQGKTPSNTFFLSPLMVFGLLSLFILFVTFKDYKKNIQSKWLDVTLFSFTGIIGILVLLLWFATDHKGTHQNYNLLWAFVLNIFVIGQLFRKKAGAWFVKYLKFLVIMLCLLTLHWIIGVQFFAIGLIPFLIALLVRYMYLIKFYSQRL